MGILNRAGLSAALVAIILAGQPALAAEKTADNADKLVAVVNGFEIMLSDVMRERRQLPPQAQSYPLAALFDFMIANIINSHLVAAEAKKIGLADDKAVKRRLLSIQDQILERELVDRQIEPKITDEKLKQRYQAFLKENPASDEVRARHILVKTEADARGLIKRAKDGENFAKLAQKHSTGPSGKAGGDLGYFTAERMVPAFSRAAFDAKPGTVVGKPVKTQFGWHVIKVEDRRAAAQPSFDETKEKLSAEMRQELSNELTTRLRKSAKIEIFGLDGRK